MKRYIPTAIDWLAITKFSPLPDGINLDMGNYIIGYVCETAIEAYSSEELGGLYDDQKWNIPVPIHMATMRQVIPRAREVLLYLVAAQILETDGAYEPGKESRKYQFTKAYVGAMKTIDIIDRGIIRRYNSFLERRYRLARTRYPALLQWFNEHLVIDLPAVELALKEVRSCKYGPFYFDYDDVILKTRCYRMVAERFSRGEFFFIADKTCGRLHTPLTNMPSEMRGAIKYNKESLWAIDLRNSQPYLLAAFLKRRLFEMESPFVGESMVYLDNNIRHAIFDCMKPLQCNFEFGADLDTFVQIVEDGLLYKEVLGLMNNYIVRKKLKRRGYKDSEVKKVKRLVLMFLYIDNDIKGRELKLVKRIFEVYFPSILQAVTLLKSNGNRYLPILLQCLERRLFLDEIAREITTSFPSAPLFTVHDSIVTTKPFLRDVRDITFRILIDRMGIRPELKVEEWKPESFVMRFFE
jgi:hypothetical protein